MTPRPGKPVPPSQADTYAGDIWIRTTIVLAVLVLALELRIGRAAAVSLSSPNGQYIAADGKAKDGYHDTIWLRDTKTGVTIDLLALNDGESPGAGEARIVAWLDNDWIIFLQHCGTGCTSPGLVNVETRSLRFFCTDGMFHLSPDKKHAVGDSFDPYMLGDKRGGLAVIAIGPANSDPDRQGACEATILAGGTCAPYNGKALEARSLSFGRWSADSKSFTYTVSSCFGGKWGAQKKRVFHLKFPSRQAKPGKLFN
ncbi:MAG TPA: hypothetical protein VMD75_05185 [Candidatus Binataceae bacterium]|nr:hypothetical protein [Candidatus Binataceae bacterium]